MRAVDHIINIPISMIFVILIILYVIVTIMIASALNTISLYILGTIFIIRFLIYPMGYVIYDLFIGQFISALSGKRFPVKMGIKKILIRIIGTILGPAISIYSIIWNKSPYKLMHDLEY